MESDYSFEEVLAIKNGYMEYDKNDQFCTKGKKYKVVKHYEHSFDIIDDANDIHNFDYHGAFGYWRWFKPIFKEVRNED